jgi:predicted glycosyltransferase
MNIWVDIINPSHALFFNVVLKDLQDERFQVTIRERAETVELTKMLGIEGRVIGSDHRNGVKKSLGMVGRTLALWTSVDSFDCALSFENGMSVMVSKMKGGRSVLLCDNDLKFFQKKSMLQYMETGVKDLADKVIIPQACYEAFSANMSGRGLFAYDGYKEDVYIADFVPDPQFMDRLPFDDYVVIRPEALASFYVLENKTIVPDLVRLFRDNNINVVYLPRDKGDAEYAAGLDAYIPEQALNGLDLCYHSSAVLTGSGTMAREAACMGKPSVSFFPGNGLLSVDRELIESGKMFHSRDPKDIFHHVMSGMDGNGGADLSRSRKVKTDVIRLIREACGS